VLQAQRDSQVLLVQRVHRDFKDLRDHRVLQELEVHRVHPVPLVIQGQ